MKALLSFCTLSYVTSVTHLVEDSLWERAEALGTAETRVNKHISNSAQNTSGSVQRTAIAVTVFIGGDVTDGHITIIAIITMEYT